MDDFDIIFGPLIYFIFFFGDFRNIYDQHKKGANVCLTPVVLVDMLGTNKMANAYGIVSFFDGLAALIGPPILSE